MALRFPPLIGTIVVCDYETGFRPPEMVKKRLAVVVSPRLFKRDHLCTVVPLSLTPPQAAVRYQCKITLPAEPPAPFEGVQKWAKADMLATVCYDRLNLPRGPRDPQSGQRVYAKIVLPVEELEKVRVAIREALGM